MVLFIESKPQDIVETEMQSSSLNSKQRAGKPHKQRTSWLLVCGVIPF